MAYVAVSHRHGKIAARGEGDLVVFDYGKNHKAALPDVLRGRIAALGGTAASLMERIAFAIPTRSVR